MASVPLKFIAPDQEDLVTLHIFEGSDQLGPFQEIDSVPAGAYPDYIDNFTTNNASSATDWFTIQWADSKGAKSPMSVPIKGGVTTLVGRVLDRVLERDATLDRRVVIQEAESAIETYANADPYSLDGDALDYRHLNGIVYLVLARSMLWRLIGSSQTSDIQVGMVRLSSRNLSTQSKANVQELFNLANEELGMSTSVVAEMQRVRDLEGRPAYGMSKCYILVIEP